MKIKYEFADGTVSEVEVEESIGAVIMNIAKSLMEQGAMTAEEYGQIDTIFRGKYRPILVSLQTEMSGYKADSMASCDTDKEG